VWVKALRLTDFRSYEAVEVSMSPGVTTFVGQNGQGKTNLVEAVSYVSTLSSHRVASDAPLVRVGAERAVIAVEAVKDERTLVIELEINPGRANRARINRAPAQRGRDVLGLLRTVLFAPEDLAMVKGDPSERRRFMDELLVQRSPRMMGVKADYERIVKQRNALLKSASVARRGSPQEVVRTLEVWDEQLAEAGADLVAARVALVQALQPHFETAYDLIAGGASAPSSSVVAMTYQSSLGPLTDIATDRQAWRDLLMAGMEARRRDEIERGVTLVGPHRDDLSLALGRTPAKGFASHGESWSIALAMRLAGLEVLRSDGDEPILILDDVFAELDMSRRRSLTERVVGGGQVLITAAVPQDVPVELAGRRLRVLRGTVVDD
jgi:DNA replication and repair protein RecF